jgi:hypothetical protein
MLILPVATFCCNEIPTIGFKKFYDLTYFHFNLSSWIFKCNSKTQLFLTGSLFQKGLCSSSSARDSRQAWIASLIFSIAPSTVSPCEKQPGKPGQLAINPLASSSSSRIILNRIMSIMRFLLKFVWVKGLTFEYIPWKT